MQKDERDNLPAHSETPQAEYDHHVSHLFFDYLDLLSQAMFRLDLFFCRLRHILIKIVFLSGLANSLLSLTAQTMTVILV